MKKAFTGLSIAVSLAVLTACEPAFAEQDSLRRQIERIAPEAAIVKIEEMPVAGLVQVSLADAVFYLSADGRYLFSGQVVDLEGNQDLTAIARAEVRGRQLIEAAGARKVDINAVLESTVVAAKTDRPVAASIQDPPRLQVSNSPESHSPESMKAAQAEDHGEADVTKEDIEATAHDLYKKLFDSIKDDYMVVYEPEGEMKKTLNVFTDPTCPYCLKLHRDIPKLTAAGVKIRYLLYPRSGVNSHAGRLAAGAFCAEDQKGAMDKAFAGVLTPPREGCESLVANHYEVGNTLSITGTPAIFTSDGEYIEGYLPAEHLLNRLGL